MILRTLKSFLGAMIFIVAIELIFLVINLPVAVEFFSLLDAVFAASLSFLIWTLPQVHNNNCGKTLISVFYRPPNANNSWIHQFIDFIDNCQYDKVIIVGDFNLPDITWIEGSGFSDSNLTLSTFCEKLIDKNGRWSTH